MYLPRRMKVEPDLSLVQDKFLVRYECYIYSGFTPVDGFYIFMCFQACYLACHLKASIGFKLQW